MSGSLSRKAGAERVFSRVKELLELPTDKIVEEAYKMVTRVEGDDNVELRAVVQALWNRVVDLEDELAAIRAHTGVFLGNRARWKVEG